MGSFKTLAPLICCALLMQSAGVTAGQATDYVDVLDLPAKASALAQRSPLLDLARAGSRLVAVGQRGHILYSDDEGGRWQQARVPVSSDLNAVTFPTPEQGWAVGGDGVVLRHFNRVTPNLYEWGFDADKAVRLERLPAPGGAMEIWLAPSLCWLPVRLRYTDERGLVVDNRLRRVSLDERP